MPGGDRTGPWGQGPMTGRGFGYCAGYQAPGYMNPSFGFRGRGRAGGRGFRHRYYATGIPGWQWFGYPRQAPVYPAQAPAQAPAPAYGPGAPFQGSPEQVDARSEREILKEQAEMLKQDLEDVNARLKELESDTEKENG